MRKESNKQGSNNQINKERKKYKKEKVGEERRYVRTLDTSERNWCCVVISRRTQAEGLESFGMIPVTPARALMLLLRLLNIL